jgi:hypothetical protein
MNEKRVLLLEWRRRGAPEYVRLSMEKYEGRLLVHLRTYYVNDKGEAFPTVKGVTIPREQLSPLREALREAEKALTPAKPTKSKKKWGQ